MVLSGTRWYSLCARERSERGFFDLFWSEKGDFEAQNGLKIPKMFIFASAASEEKFSGYSVVLSGTQWYSMVLSGTRWYSLVLSVTGWYSVTGDTHSTRNTQFISFYSGYC